MEVWPLNSGSLNLYSSILVMSSIVACSSTTVVPGVYTRTQSALHREVVELDREGDYRFYSWSIDGAKQCEASGSWEFTDSTQTKVRTTIEKYRPASFQTNCHTQPTSEVWNLKANTMMRIKEGQSEIEFRRTRRRQFN